MFIFLEKFKRDCHMCVYFKFYWIKNKIYNTLYKIYILEKRGHKA